MCFMGVAGAVGTCTSIRWCTDEGAAGKGYNTLWGFIASGGFVMELDSPNSWQVASLSFLVK